MITTHYIQVGPLVSAKGSGGSSNVVIESEDQATEESTIYFKKKDNPVSGDQYDEFVIINGAKEQIGNTTESISETELAQIISSLQD